MKTDSFFYRFFSKFARAFFMLLGEDERKAERYKFTSVEVKEQAFRFDGLFVPQNRKDFLYFAEAQFRLEDDFYLRFFAEIAVFIRQKKPVNPWRAVVIFPSKAFDPGVTQHYEEYFENGRLRRIYLADLPKELVQKFPLNLVRIILTSKRQAVATAESLVQQLPQEKIAKKEQDDFIQLLINLLLSKLPQMSRKEIETMLEPMLSDIRKSRFYREVAEELMPEVKRKLRPEIAQELRPEIAQERNREIAQTMLKKNFEAELIAEITGLSLEQILALKQT